MDLKENSSELIYYLNGTFLPESELEISPLDRGFLLGDGVFETIKALNFKPLLFPQHYERMISAARLLEIYNLPDVLEVENIVVNLLKRNNLKDAYIRITTSSGRENSSSPTIFIMTSPLRDYDKTLYNEGVSILISKYRKYELTPAAKIKTTSYEENLILRREAKSFDCFESIVCNHSDHICEGSFSNVFILLDGKVITPDTDLPILPGVTRKAVIDLCCKNHIDITENRFFLKEFLRAEEIFLSSTLMDIMPVTKVLTYPLYNKVFHSSQDIKKTDLEVNIIGSGKPGYVTTKLMKLFKQLFI